tara:strand:- start:452 stop:1141 length:690 start_codon:yes stop_codon:yes gene_type:complete
MYVRKDPFKGKRRKQMKKDTILEMEDYCSILLYARYVREVDGDMSKLDPKLIPIVRRGGIAMMPEEVCEEFDNILQKVLETIQVIDVDPEGFFENLARGEVDPIGEVINAPEVKQALGNVVMRKLRITDRLTGDAAFEKTKELMPAIRDELSQFIGQFMFNGIFDLAEEGKKLGIPLTHISKVLDPKVTRLSRQGIGVETFVDHEALTELQGELKTNNNDDRGFDIMHG